jgi:hypothetical protein
VTYNRGQTPTNPAQIPGFLRKELEKLQRALATAASLAWASITGTPTTLAGYGITDANPLTARAGLTITTGSLASLAAETSSIAMAAHTMALLTIEADRACRVRLYASTAAQTADAGRALGTSPAAGIGVLGEFQFTGAATIPCSPVAILANDETSPVRTLYYAVQNRSGSTSTVALTLNVIPLEP